MHERELEKDLRLLFFQTIFPCFDDNDERDHQSVQQVHTDVVPVSRQCSGDHVPGLFVYHANILSDFLMRTSMMQGL